MHLKDKTFIAFKVYILSTHGFPENQALDLDITVVQATFLSLQKLKF